MLMGEYDYSIDEKGRLGFPPRFREELGTPFVVTRWLDDCLIAFSQQDWMLVAAALAEKGLVKSRDARRFLYAKAAELTPDKQGRILLPEKLRRHAGLQKDTIVIGLGRYAEIWDAQTWRRKDESLCGEAVEAAMEELEI